MAEHDAFTERERALEDSYFRKKDRELIERMRQAAEAERLRGELGQKTGLTDPALLQELLDLGFTPETVVLLPLVPVLEVAWAESGITVAERELVVKFARSRGIEEGSAADQQLAQWLTVRPDQIVFEHAGRLIAAILQSGSGEAASGLTAEGLVAYCEKIASASGGIFGTSLRAITAEERTLLSRIASELKTRTG